MSWLGGLRGMAEEPYERFLSRLRDEQLFDLALVYLDDLEDKPNVDADFKADIQLERGLLLYQAAAVLPASNPTRTQKLDDAETALRTFLDNHRRHPRRGEARLKLGELLLTRAEEANKRAGDDFEGDTPAAIKFYDDAHQLFEATVEELAGILEGLKGARVDPNDKAKVAYRQKLRQDVRQAQLLSAKAVEERGRSRAENNPQRTADLQQALQMLNDLYAKEQDMVGIRNYALFYRSAIQASLGMLDDAVDGFQRIADLEGVDVLRPLQTNSVAELVKLLAGQGKYAPAVDRGDKWLAGLRPDERSAAETMALKLELAKQKIAWSEQLKEQAPDDRVAARLIRDTRTELRSMLRTPGPHLEPARALLSELGVESAERVSSELPKVKDFGEALAAAQERIDRSETDALGLAGLEQEAADPQTPEAQKQELKQQLAAIQEAIDTDRQQAIELLHIGLRLFRADEDDRELLFDARFRLAFLLLKQQRPWEAISVAEFLARSSAATDKGLRAAAITLGAYGDLLRTADPQAKAALAEQLQPFTKFLIESWPRSSEASAAASALVQLALINQDWEQVDKYLQLVPAGDPAAAKLRRTAGISFYAKYLEEKTMAGEENEATRTLRQRAIDALQLGLENTTADSLDADSIEASNILVRLLLNVDGQAAAELMFDSPASPLKAVDQGGAAVPAKVAMETYRTAVQLTSMQLAEGKLSASEAVGRIKAHIESLQSAAKQDTDNQTLAKLFVSLARDLNEQLAAATDDSKRQKMSEALLLVAVEAAKSESFNTRYWAADTILSVAEQLPSTTDGKAQAESAFEAAAGIMRGILAKEQSQPGWIEPPSFVTQVRMRLAQAARGQGDYRAALEHLATILEENPMLLDVQMEAARTYQAWGSATSGFHKLAIEGGRPDPQTRKKLIWGWGRIQEITANRPDYSPQFFEARYQLAYSRWRYALGLADAAAKSAEIARAEKDIVSTAKLFPELGGPEMKQKFTALLSAIRKSN